jgi:hypothetical protein
MSYCATSGDKRKHEEVDQEEERSHKKISTNTENVRSLDLTLGSSTMQFIESRICLPDPISEIELLTETDLSCAASAPYGDSSLQPWTSFSLLQITQVLLLLT